MEFEQLVKRLEWLDEEHRKTRTSIITLEERMTALEGETDAVAKQIKSLVKQIADTATTAARLDQFDAIFAKQREDMNKVVDDLEKKHAKREKESVKRHQQDLQAVNKDIDGIRKSLTEVTQIKRDIKARVTEESRLQQAVKDLKQEVEEAVKAADQATRMQTAFEESRKQETKRLADLQGELTALRKRIDEARAKADLGADALKNTDNRVKELMLSEAERKSSQAAFIESQSVAQVDRERSYKEWKENFESFKKQSQTLDSQIQTIEETLRNARRAQETYHELNTKLERRINEVTEMQRLAEDRLRQEWVTFKADDQKRWTGYTLSQDESAKDVRRAVQKVEERIGALDESAQTIQDQLHQTSDTTEQQLQELMNVAHEWLSAYQRIMGHDKSAKKTKK